MPVTNGEGRRSNGYSDFNRVAGHHAPHSNARRRVRVLELLLFERIEGFAPDDLRQQRTQLPGNDVRGCFHQ